MKNISTILKFTFIEVYRSKIMVSLGLLGAGLIVVCFVASEFAYGAPSKIALDVGLGVTSLSNVVIAILIGATLLTKEIEQKTLYMILSRPISRTAFLFGKILGLSSVLLINTLILGAVTLSLFLFYDGSFQGLFLWTLYFSFLEAITVLLFAVFFSLVTNTTLSVIYTFGIYVVGHAINETSKIMFAKMSPLFSTLLDVVFLVVPNFYRLNLKDLLLYRQNVSVEYLMITHLYLFLYLVALSFSLQQVFKNRNLD